MDPSSYEVYRFFNVQDYLAVFYRQRVIREAIYDISDNRQDIPCLAKQGSYPRVHVKMISHFFIMLFTPVGKKKLPFIPIALPFSSHSNSDLTLQLSLSLGLCG